ncbi:MAG: hypothetical protein ABSH20_31385, partial [Tepidisphaeraceae bacterium]
GLAAASYLFGEIQKHYAAIKAAMEAKIDVTNWSDLNAAIQHTAATLTQAVESADIFYDRIHRLESAQQSLVEKTNEAAATLKRQAEGADKARDAAEKTELAKISAQEKVGIISPEKAASEKAAIEQKYDKQRVDAAAQLDHQLIRQRVDERAAIESRGGARIDERTAAAEQAGTAASALGNAKARDEELGKQQAALEKYMTEHGKVLTLAQVQDERRKAQMVEAERRQVQTETLPAAEREDKAARARLEAADKAIEDAAKRKTELDRQIPQMQAQADADRRSRGAAYGAATAGRTLEQQAAAASSPTGKLIASVANSEHTLQSGGSIGAKEQAQINILNQMLQQKGRGDPKTLEILGKLVGHDEQLFAQIAALAKRLDGVKLQARNSFNQ